MRPIFTISSSAAVEQISFCLFFYIFVFLELRTNLIRLLLSRSFESERDNRVDSRPFQIYYRIAFSTFLYSAHEKRAFIGYRV